MLKNLIYKGNIKESLENVCIILHMNDERINKLSDTFIEICNYIGLNMEKEDVLKWLNIVELTYIWITSDLIKVDDTLILCVKMCNICKNIFENNIIQLKNLRSQVINDFENKLSIEYIRNFEQILPLPTSESYSISCKILMCFITFYNKINDISDDNNDFNLLTNKIRLSIEYIVRKNIYIENQSTRDGDCIWFLWNIILQLSQSPFINILYKLFIFEWKSNCKKKRLGLLYGSVFLIKYKDINWTDTDLENFDKIKNLSKNFMINIKEKYPKTVKKNKVTYSNINIWDNYIPINKN